MQHERPHPKWPEPLDGMFAAALRVYQSLPEHKQRKALDALRRFADGQPFEACMVELLVELGDSPAQAREKVLVRETLDTDWREILN